MTKVYLDTSVLGAYYTPEEKSDAVETALCQSSRGFEWVISALVETEFVSLVARKRREGLISHKSLKDVLEAFEQDKRERFTVLPLSLAVHQTARDLLLRSKLPIRSLDALHLSVALTIGENETTTQLWTADKRMAEVVGTTELHLRLF